MQNETGTTKNLKVIAYLLGFITFVICVYILMALSEILIPVTIAIFLTFLLHPLLVYLGKYKIPKAVSVLLLLLLLFTSYYLIALLLISNVSVFAGRSAAYSENLKGYLQGILQPFNITIQQFGGFFKLNTQNFNLNEVYAKLVESGILTGMLNSLTKLLSDFFITMIFWIFMIMGKEKFEERLKVAFKNDSGFISRSLNNIDSQLQTYLVVKTILSLIVGAFVTVVLLIFNVDFALLWGFLTFTLNFIPNIGSLIATVAPILMSLLEYGFGFQTISVTILLLACHNIVGNIVEPKYLGRKMDLSPVFVLFSLIFWGWVWGIVGMFLAVPIAAAMKILFSNIQPLKPIAVLMGSKAEEAV